MTLPIAIAVLAALAWVVGGNNIAAAAREFVRYCRLLKLKAPAHPYNFIRYWAGRVTSEGGIIGRAHNAGRPRSVTAQQVERAYQGIIGWRAAGRRRPYASRADCEENCPEVRRVLRQSGVTMNTLIRRIRKAHPNFQFKKLRVKWQLSDDNKQQRVTICQTLLQHFRALLHRVVFVDAKTVWMWEEEVWGWGDTSVPNYSQGIKPAYNQGRIIRLKYYAAVHSKLGPVWIKFYTGTSGMPHNRDGHNYQVSLCHQQLGSAPTFHMSHSISQLGSPSGCLGILGSDALIHTQPQNTPTLLHCCISIQPVLELPLSHGAVSVVGLGD